MKRHKIRVRSEPKVKKNNDGQPRERFEGLRREEFREFIRGQKCLLHGQGCMYVGHQSDAAHVESKARGAGDEANLIPLCRRHHQETHDYGQRNFEREHAELLGNKPLREFAGEFWLAYEKVQGVGI